ncbi:hypothetical protein GCM10027515_26300 [Schumannella luteola]|uniref:Uncharacterized protein n=1 Tax=Schumannella luteola TaxID=472059 RepID=A0A852YCL7_9MICO|nr:hypothetical protein [Schumannella luteola]NYG99572.1 hypothetical protein [Schumannella luteola]TPX01979.1 hypothetical protein FJ656_24400 [Schumannella luteola]
MTPETDPSTPHDDAAIRRPARSDRAARAAEQQARAEEVVQRIFAGGDLGAETQALSNRFTDETSARWLRRLRRRPSSPDAGRDAPAGTIGD